MKKYLHAVNHKYQTFVSTIELYRWFMMKETGIYTSLNKMKKGDQFFMGLFWTPLTSKQKIREVIDKIKENRNVSGPQLYEKERGDIMPPSYFQQNEFNETFQLITDTYGVPTYKEVNPSVFGIVTFPFLFGVMFGDIGHGFIVFLFGLALIWVPGLFNRIGMGQMVKARYLICMMGFMATYCGILYNDFMSLPIQGYTSCYERDGNKFEKEDGCTYPMGVDHAWYLGHNELTYFNSMKMKIAVILGVSQMVLGILMKGVNAIYKKDSLELLHEFLPQLILMLCLFGWMDFLIIAKWNQDWDGRESRAPSVLAIMISMFLNFGALPPGTDPIIEGQVGYSNLCLIVSLLCIPWMLLVKPLIIKSRMDKEHPTKPSYRSVDNDEEDAPLMQEADDDMRRDDVERDGVEMQGPGKMPKLDDSDSSIGGDITKLIKGEEASHDFTEIFIHQLIETIEFTLGTVSNTASYLRLWALSLAHGQLAHVFYEKLVGSAGSNPILVSLYLTFS